MNHYMPEGMLISTDKNFEYTSSKEGLEKAMRSGAILEGVATLCDHNYSLHISLPSGIKAIIPKAESVYSPGDTETKGTPFRRSPPKTQYIVVLDFI